MYHKVYYYLYLEIQSLAVNGVTGIKRFIISAGRYLDDKGWELVKERIVKFFNDNMPTELLDSSSLLKKKEELDKLREKLLKETKQVETDDENKDVPVGVMSPVPEKLDETTSGDSKATPKPDEKIESPGSIDDDSTVVSGILSTTQTDIYTRPEPVRRGRMTIGSEVGLLPAGSIVDVPCFTKGVVREVREDNIVVVQFPYAIGYFPLNATLLLSVDDTKDEQGEITLPFSPARVVTKCLIQLELLKATCEVYFIIIYRLLLHIQIVLAEKYLMNYLNV